MLGYFILGLLIIIISEYVRLYSQIKKSHNTVVISLETNLNKITFCLLNNEIDKIKPLFLEYDNFQIKEYDILNSDINGYKEVLNLKHLMFKKEIKCIKYNYLISTDKKKWILSFDSKIDPILSNISLTRSRF